MSAISSACSPRVGQRHEQRVDVHTELLGVLRVERVLRVDEGGDSAGLLRVGDGVERQRRLARRLRTVDLDDAPAGKSSDAERDVEGDGSGGDHGDRGTLVAAEAHDGSLAELAVDLCECRLKGFLAVCWGRHCRSPSISLSCAQRLSFLRRPMMQGPRSRDRAVGWHPFPTISTVRSSPDIGRERRAFRQ
jgi:hypothetical protein